METPSPSRNEVSTSPPMRARVRTVNMYQFDIQLKKWYILIALERVLLYRYIYLYNSLFFENLFNITILNII